MGQGSQHSGLHLGYIGRRTSESPPSPINDTGRCWNWGGRHLVRQRLDILRISLWLSVAGRSETPSGFPSRCSFTWQCVPFLVETREVEVWLFLSEGWEGVRGPSVSPCSHLHCCCLCADGDSNKQHWNRLN